jgi:hypothetical protein
MTFERITVKKLYYYVICGITLFILLWGAVDVVSSVLSLTVFKGPSIGLDMPSDSQGGASKNAAEPMMDEYYQGKMAIDKIGDSMARLIVAGCVFLYASSRVRELESKEI